MTKTMTTTAPPPPDDEPNLPPEATIQPCVPVSLVVTTAAAGAGGEEEVVRSAEIRLDPSSIKNANGTARVVHGGEGGDASGERNGDKSAGPRSLWWGCFVVGRQASSCDVRIQHASISRRHAILYAVNDPIHEGNENEDDRSRGPQHCRLFLRDLGGKHGTYVNGRRVDPHTSFGGPKSCSCSAAATHDVELKAGDEIRFGNVRQTFRVQIGGGSDDAANLATNDDPGSLSHVGDGSTIRARPVEPSDPPPRPPDHENDAPPPVDASAALRDTAKPPVDHRSRMEVAGEGLSGRARRQAEIEAMMASLDDAPTYRVSAAAPPQPQPPESGGGGGTSAVNDGDDDDEHDEHEGGHVARDHRIPITQKLTIPSEMKASTTATATHPRGNRGGVVTCLAMDAAGSRFVLGGSDGHLRFYDVGGMRKNRLESFLDVVPEEGHLLQSVAFSPSGDRLLVATSSVQPTVLDRDGHVVVQFCRGDMYVTDPAKTVGHTAQVTCVDWHPLERDVVLTGGLDGSARLWNLNGKTQFEKLVCDKVFVVKNVKGQRTSVTSVAFHPGGREFAVGTSCGSLQIFSRARVSVTRPERARYGAHGGAGGGGDARNSISSVAVTSLAYSVDGSKLASRCAQDSTVRVWDPRRLSRSSLPLLDCGIVEATHENANICFNPEGSLLCVGQSIALRSGSAREERGSLQIFQVPDTTAPNVQFPSKQSSPILELPFDDAAPLIVRWHVKLNQIFVACADGRILILFDPNISQRGGALLISSSKLSRDVDDLSKLLKRKAEASTTVTGEIYTPLTMPRGKPLLESESKRKRLERKDPVKSHEPERPASGKHKTGGQTGGSVTFQQFVADQRVSKAKAIAGKDPREALFQYTEGKNYVGTAYEGNEQKLAEKTAEEEQEELKKAGR